MVNPSRDGLVVNFSAFHYENDEKALELDNSKGSRQGRLHLFDYKGEFGKDPYAVATKEMPPGSDTKLGFWDRWFYVLCKPEGSETWYKVNKNSLRKRLGIEAASIETDETGKCTNFDTLISNQKEFLKTEQQQWLSKVSKDWRTFKNVPPRLKHDKDIALKAVKGDGQALQDVSNDLKDDPDILGEALKFDNAYEYTSQNFKDKLNNDRDFAIQAVRINGNLLKYAINFQNDSGVVVEAVKEFAQALQYAGDVARGDRKVVLEAIKDKIYGRHAFALATMELRNNREFVLECIEINPHVLSGAGDEIRDDENIVMKAIKKAGTALDGASQRLKNKENVVLEAIQQDAEAFVYAGREMKKNKKVALEAIRKKVEVLAWADDSLKNNEEFLQEAEKINSGAREHAKRKGF